MTYDFLHKRMIYVFYVVICLLFAPTYTDAAVVSGSSASDNSTLSLTVSVAGSVIVLQNPQGATSCIWNGTDPLSEVVSESSASSYAASLWAVENPTIGASTVVCSGGTADHISAVVYASDDGGTLAVGASATDWATGGANPKTFSLTTSGPQFSVAAVGTGNNGVSCSSGCVVRAWSDYCGDGHCNRGGIVDSDGAVDPWSFSMHQNTSGDWNAAMAELVESHDGGGEEEEATSTTMLPVFAGRMHIESFLAPLFALLVAMLFYLVLLVARLFRKPERRGRIYSHRAR